MKIEETIKMTQNLLSVGLAGLIYGSLSGADPIVAACAFTTAGIAREALAHMIRKFEPLNNHKIVAAVISVVGISTLEIVAFRHLNLIARTGTIFFAAFYSYCTIIALEDVRTAVKKQALLQRPV
jgi:hypothetical protein